MPVRPGEHDAATLIRWTERRRQVGTRIRQLRLDQGLTQEALALASGISRNQLLVVEAGTSTLAAERLFDLADALGVPAAELLKPAYTGPDKTPSLRTPLPPTSGV